MTIRHSHRLFFFITSMGVLFLFAGCEGSLAPRLGNVVGNDSISSGDLRTTDPEWVSASKIGLMVHSDATATHAAPSIPDEYVHTLAQRAEEFVRLHCYTEKILMVSPTVHQGPLLQDILAQARGLQVPYVMVIVLSSRERAGPEKFGEATMMTQMTGTVTENSGLAEIGMFRVQDGSLVFYSSGQGTETMEQLDAPIGLQQGRATGSHDILRARAGQYALDRALKQVESACRQGKP